MCHKLSALLGDWLTPVPRGANSLLIALECDGWPRRRFTDSKRRRRRIERSSISVTAARPQAELVKTLRKESEEFSRLWQHHEVAKRFDDHKTLIHPELGPMNVDCQALFTEDQAQALLVLTARPQSGDFSKLQLLAVLGNEHMSSHTQVEQSSGGSVPSA